MGRQNPRSGAVRCLTTGMPALALTLFALGSSGAHGALDGQQVPESTGQALLGVGFAGGGTRGPDANGGLVIQLDLHGGRHHFTLRALGMGDVSNFPDGSGDGVEEVALLYGRQARARPGYFTLGAGLGRVSAEGFTGASDEQRSTVGLSLLAEASLQSTPIGAGLQIFGNVNSIAAFAGVAILLHLGWST